LESGIGGHRWLRILVLAVALYILFLPVWWYTLNLVAAFAGTISDLIYHFFDPLVSINHNGKSINVVVSAPPGTGFTGETSSSLRLDRCTYGLPLLGALILVTRSDSWLLKLRTLAIGVALMVLLTIPAVMFWAKLASLQVDDQVAGGGNRASLLYYGFHGYAFSQPVLAVMIWLGLMVIGSFRSSQPHAGGAEERAVSRNEPCPCGSGRKYKKCCGTS
jgi:hypothetical protein